MLGSQPGLQDDGGTNTCKQLERIFRETDEHHLSTAEIASELGLPTDITLFFLFGVRLTKPLKCKFHSGEIAWWWED